MWRTREAAIRTFCVLVTLVATGCASGPGIGTFEASEGFASSGAFVAYGPIAGFVQIPKGGRPGSTSGQRPTLQELDLTESLSVEAPLRLEWGPHLLYASARLTQFSSSGVLDERLISHADVFPAAARIDTELGLDRYRLGYGYRFEVEPSNGSALRFGPTVGVALLDFSYRLSERGAADTFRAFVLGAAQLGWEAHWSPGGPFSIGANLAATLPIPGTLQMSSIEVAAVFQLFGDEERGGRVLLGIGYEWLEYEDRQTEPNHIQARIGPVAALGLEIRF